MLQNPITLEFVVPTAKRLPALSGLGVYALPSPSNPGTFTGNEFKSHVSEYKALADRADTLGSAIDAMPDDNRFKQALNTVEKTFNTAATVALSKIDSNWDWGAPFNRTSEREAALQSGYNALMNALRNFVAQGEPLLKRAAAETAYVPPPTPEEQAAISARNSSAGIETSSHALTSTSGGDDTMKWIFIGGAALAVVGVGVVLFKVSKPRAAPVSGYRRRRRRRRR